MSKAARNGFSGCFFNVVVVAVLLLRRWKRDDDDDGGEKKVVLERSEVFGEVIVVVGIVIVWRVLLQRFIRFVRLIFDEWSALIILFKENLGLHIKNLSCILKTLTQTYANVCSNGIVGYYVRFTSFPFAL